MIKTNGHEVLAATASDYQPLQLVQLVQLVLWSTNRLYQRGFAVLLLPWWINIRFTAQARHQSSMKFYDFLSLFRFYSVSELLASFCIYDHLWSRANMGKREQTIANQCRSFLDIFADYSKCSQLELYLYLYIHICNYTLYGERYNIDIIYLVWLYEYSWIYPYISLKYH